MRTYILLASTTMLVACGGAGPQSAGTVAPPTTTTGGGTTTATHTFVDPTETKVYKAVGASHSYEYSTSVLGAVQVDPNTNNPILDGNGNPARSITGSGQGSQLYQGDATTVRNTDLTIEYNPRDAIFNVNFTNSAGGTSATSRFQDPLHRTDFGGALGPQQGTPDLGSAAWNIPGINYLESGSANNIFSPTTTAGEFVFDLIDPSQGGSYDVTTFFYQTPGTETQYVTFAGYLRNSATVSKVEVANADGSSSDYIQQSNDLERGAFAYGEITANDAVPTSGTGSFSGSMLATMVFNDQPDTTGNTDTYFQWIAGRATTNVDFGANTFALALDGVVGSPFFDGTSRQLSVLENATFNANGAGSINLVNAGGFLGQFSEAWFVNPNGNRLDLVIAGSSIDGAFYGPNGEEVGGGYRIVGGTPDERIDILGTFVGKQD
jgi:hypothetical protein